MGVKQTQSLKFNYLGAGWELLRREAFTAGK